MSYIKLRRIFEYKNFGVLKLFNKEDVKKFTKNKDLRKKKFFREIIYINNESL